MTLRKRNYATWSRGKNGWQLLITFERDWEAPAVGAGIGETFKVQIRKKDQHAGQWEVADVRLTSRVFRSGGKLQAFAEVS